MFTRYNIDRERLKWKGGESMSSREDAVLNMQITLIPILAKSWKLSLEQLRDLFKEYDVLNYIDVCYEALSILGSY